MEQTPDQVLDVWRARETVRRLSISPAFSSVREARNNIEMRDTEHPDCSLHAACSLALFDRPESEGMEENM